MGNLESCAEQALEAEKLRQLESAAFLQDRKETSSLTKVVTSTASFKFAEATVFKAQASAWIDQFCKNRTAALSINSPERRAFAHSYNRRGFLGSAQSATEHAGQKQEDLNEAAACLLEQLEEEHDKKLSECKFVAYLKQLAGFPKSTVNTWQPDPFISESASWNSWNALNRNWFAASATEDRYSRRADNITTYMLHDHKDANINADSLEANILKTEAEIAHNPNDASKWWVLGKLNALNEDDSNAIAAYKNATKAINDAKVDYAVSCFNINCLSDAVGAIEDYLQAESGYRPDVSTSGISRISQIIPSLLELNSTASLNALAILYCINEDAGNAIKTIETLIMRDKLVRHFNHARTTMKCTIDSGLFMQTREIPNVHMNAMTKRSPFRHLKNTRGFALTWAFQHTKARNTSTL